MAKSAMKQRVLALLTALCLLCMAVGWSLSLTKVSAEGEDSVPSTDRMVDLITENSTASVPWSVPTGVQADYAYDAANGATIAFQDQASITAAGMLVSHDGAENGKTIHVFETELAGTADSPMYSYNTFVFRSDGAMGDFIALAFRQGAGAVKIISRVGGTFYTADNDKWPAAQGGYALVTNNAQLSAGGRVQVVIESDADSVRVWFNGVLGYEDDLLADVPAATGLFLFGDASTYGPFKAENVHCYTNAPDPVPPTEEEPATDGMKDLLSAESEDSLVWSAPAGATSEFSYDNGATFNLGNTDGVGSAAQRVFHDSPDYGRVVHTFETQLAGTASEPMYSWNTFIFRADQGTGDFIAFAFRQGVGAMKIISRVDEVFYTAESDGFVYSDNGTPDDPSDDKSSQGGYPLVTLNEQLSAGGKVEVTIESDYDTMKVWINGELAYESDLLHRLPAATGIFAYSAASSYSGFKVENAHCYTEDYTKMNNAVNEDSIIYSPFGGGGAQGIIQEGGAYLAAGSSKDGTAVFSGPTLTGKTVQTYTFVMDSPDVWAWSNVYIRADATQENYIAFRVRRAFGHAGFFGQVNGYNLAYANNEPFADENIAVLPLVTLPNSSGETNLPQGTELNFTFVSDQEGIVVYLDNTPIIVMFYDELEVAGDNPSYGLDIAELPGYLAAIPATTGMYGGVTGSYQAAEFKNVNCWYEGEKLPDTIANTFLTDMQYNKQTIEGFSPGSFEYDVTISGDTPVNQDSLVCTAPEGVTVSEPVWSVNETSGYTEATITVTAGDIVRTYKLTFEVYDTPQPFEPEEWPEEDASGGCNSTAAVQSGSIFCASVAAAVLAVCLKKGKRGN